MTEPYLAARPKPEQLFELASTCMDLGRSEKNRLSLHRKTNKALANRQNQKTFKSDFLSDREPTFYDFVVGGFRSVSRRYFGRVAMTPDTAWAMSIHDASLLFEEDKPVDGFHVVHSFMWTGREVLKAMRRVRHIEFEAESCGESYQPLVLDSCAFKADFLHAANETRRVTQGDCVALRQEIVNFNFALHKIAA